MRTNLHTGINELTVPTRASALRSKFAFLAIVVLAVFGLTNAGRTQERNPPDERQPDVVQDSGTTLSEAREVPAGSAASQPAAQLASPPVANIEKNIARIGETANWRFVTKDFIETIEKRQSELQGVAVNVLGVVRDEHGDFVEGAFVLLRLVSASSLVHRIDGQAKDVFAVTWTDDKGVFAFHNQATPWFESARPIDWELCVFAPGHAIETREYLNLDGQIRKEEIELQPEQVIEVTIKDSEGRPISDIDFAHVEIVDPYDNADLEYSLLGSEMQHFIQPDKQGRIRIGGLPRQRIATIIPRHGRVTGGKRGVHIATSADLEPQKMIAKERPRSGLVYPYLKPTCEIVAERLADNPARNAGSKKSTKQIATRTVTVRVVNVESGAGVSGVTVGWETEVHGLRVKPGMQATDKEGTAKLEIPQASVDVFVGGRRFGFVTHYTRITTDPEEYTPPVERGYWVKRISQGGEDLSVTFELQPVPPLQIATQKEDGTPVIAELHVVPRGWLQPYRIPVLYSDEEGQASVAIRPVWFSVDITATTEDGLKGNVTSELSKDWTKPDKVKVVVR